MWLSHAFRHSGFDGTIVAVDVVNIYRSALLCSALAIMLRTGIIPPWWHIPTGNYRQSHLSRPAQFPGARARKKSDFDS